MKNKALPLLLALVLVLGLLGAAPIHADEIPDVTDYSYTITPVLSPFAYYLYVQTDNPDPTSFRLVDETSVFYDEDSYGEVRVDTENGYYYQEVDPGTYYIAQYVYPDVVYEDETIFRVPGGYIFRASGAYSDGGEFILQQKISSGDKITKDLFEQTDITIPCEPLHTRVSWLVETCADESLTLFENLDAVEARLSQLAIYPRSVYDVNSPNEERPYPFLAASPYPELILNNHYEMYDTLSSGLLASAAYPFVLDSLGYPGTIGAVAEELEPECEATAGSLHYMVDVTFDGETRTYGGAGAGGYDPLYSDRAVATFAFGDSPTPDIETICQILKDYDPVAQADAAQYADLISGEIFQETIRATGGTWIQVATEGFGYGTSFAYAVPCGTGIQILSDAWVDGRYINNREIINIRSTFEDYPTADIVIRDMTYTDQDGAVHTQDVVFTYDDSLDAWTARLFYSNGIHYYPAPELPDEMILTQEEVAAMDIDGNSYHWPVDGLIYDGTVYPGTPFTNILVTGISVPETLEVIVEHEAQIPVILTPDNAGDTRIEWSCSDTSVVKLLDSSTGLIQGLTEGTAVLTATTVDGAYSSSCTVTVLPDPCIEGHDFGEYISDNNATCTKDGTKTAVCLRCGDTDTITDPGTRKSHTPGESVREDEAEDGSYYLVTYCDVCGWLLSWDYVGAPGDVNGDGEINGRDVITLRQHLAGWNVEIDLHAANVNGDPNGTVNGLDMILLRQYIAGWNVTLGP